MHNYSNDELTTFKTLFYAKMKQVFDTSLRRACYSVTEEAILFVDNYPNQDKEFMGIVNNVIVEFLNDFESQLYHSTKSADKMLVD